MENPGDVKNEHQEPWRKIIGEGWTWSSRVNRFKWIPVLFSIGLVCSIGWDVVSTAHSFKKAKLGEGVGQVTTWDRFTYEPITTAVNALRGVFQHAPRPVFDSEAISRLKLFAPPAQNLGTEENMREWVAAQVEALNKTGQLDVSTWGGCETFGSLSELSGKINGTAIHCKRVGDRIWIISAVKQSTWAMPIFGVMRKGDDGWRWYDIWTGEGQATAGGKNRVQPNMIAPTMASDLPELFKAGESKK